MSAEQELVALLADTRLWASKQGNVDTSKLYSDWASLEALLLELDQYLADAEKGVADFSKLRTLYAPTAGLCEVIASDASAQSYLSLASRFDAWQASVRVKE